MSIADDALADLSQSKSISDQYLLPSWVKPFSIVLLIIFILVAFVYYFHYLEEEKPNAAFDKLSFSIDQ